MPTAMVNGATLNYVDEGAGPVLLLVHGFPLNHTMWKYQIEDLKEDHRVIAPDLRGFGASSVTPGVVSMAQMADDLAGLLESLKIEAPIFLCGLSMGGYVAWQFIKRYSAKLAGVILCDTRAVADKPEEAQTRRDTADKVLKEGPGFLAEAMIKKLFAETTFKEQPKLIEETKKTILANNPEGIAAAARGMAERPDIRQRLGSIMTPSLVIVGTHDAISTVAEMTEIAEELPVSMFVEIPGAGHMSPLEAPDPVNTTIRDFICRLTNKPPVMEMDGETDPWAD
jgi:3-oxoadipate enol-lactonase